MNPVLLALLTIAGVAGLSIIIKLLQSIQVVPARTARVVERLGKYSRTLEAGLHILMPFIDKVAYTHSLKEKALNVPPQPCFTQDNVKVSVDGVIYMQVMDPNKASYGITKKHVTHGLTDYEYATVQLAQTTMRSVIGQLELDKTFEERELINSAIVKAVDEATDPWGVRVSRYEIQNIEVPQRILTTMERQVSAERTKRALITESEGTMQSTINESVGSMEEDINQSEGEKMKRINEAEGRAQEILSISKATAMGIKKVAASIAASGGEDAVSLQLTEMYINELQSLAKSDTKLILPMDLTDLGSITNKVNEMLGQSKK